MSIHSNLYKWHKFPKSMVGGPCPKNHYAIYICHSNGIHYDVLDVLSDTKLASSNCFSNTCKRKIEQQESDSEDNISIKKKFKVSNVFKSGMHAQQGTESKLSLENVCHAHILKNGNTSFGTSKLDNPVDSVCMSSTERPILHEQLKAKTHKSNKNLSRVFKNAGTNINHFHKSINFLVYQCSICQEAWPLKAKPKSPSSYIYQTRGSKRLFWALHK